MTWTLNVDVVRRQELCLMLEAEEGAYPHADVHCGFPVPSLQFQVYI